MLKRNIFNLPVKKLSDIKNRAEELIRPMINRVYEKQKTVAFKQNIRKGSEIDQNSLLIWKYLVIQKTLETKLSENFNRNRLDNDFFRELIELSCLSNGPKFAKEYLGKFGIHLIIVNHFKKTHLDGAAFIIDDKPVIGLTLRHDRVDNFWFVLFHELAHIKLHLTDDSDCAEFIDDLDMKNVNEKEIEADQFATEMIMNYELWEKIKSELESGEKLDNLSKKYKIHPAIIAGRYRKEKDNYRLYSRVVCDSKVRQLFI